MLFCGIDPGQTGGIGIVDRRGQFVGAHRWNAKSPRDIYIILYNIRDRVINVYIENVNLPTTGTGIDNQFSATGNLLINTGIWHGWLIALCLDYCEVAPATWQAAHGLFQWKRKLSEARAPGSLVPHSPLSLARSQWPQAPLEFKADDGKAVGLLLADLARRDNRAGIDRAVMQQQARTKTKAKHAQARKLAKITPTLDMPW